VEQNHKYKTAMKVLYANRRLSIQPDNIIVPSIELDDVPLVHEILDRLGLVSGEKAPLENSSRSSEPEERSLPPPSTPTVSTLDSNSMFDTSTFESMSTITPDPGMLDFDYNDLDMSSFDNDMGVSLPFEVYSSINPMTDNFYASPSGMFKSPDWCPLDVLNSVMHSDYPSQQY